MSGKRVAENQITSLRPEDESGDEEMDNEPRLASLEVLSRRKILKPRGMKSVPKRPSPLALSLPINGNGSSNNTVDTKSKIKALNINFVNAINKLKDLDITADFRPILSKYEDYFVNSIEKSTAQVQQGSFSLFTKQISATEAEKPSAFSFNKPSNAQSQLDTQPNALPLFKPAAQLQETAEPKLNAFAQLGSAKVALSPVESKPNAFALFKPATESLSQLGTTPNAFAMFNKSTPVEPSKPFAFALVKPAEKAPEPVSELKDEPKITEISSSDSESDDEIKIEGPKFTLTLPPTTKNSVFTFGAKPKPEIEFSDSDSEDDIKVEGPKFTMASNPSTTKSFFGNFKLSDNSNGFKFPVSASTESKESDSVKPSTLETAPTTAGEAPKFSFGAPASTPATTEPEDKPKPFTFGTTTQAQPDTELKPFSFNTESVKTSTDAPKPFSFGAPAATPAQPVADKPKPFTFGASALSSESEPKPFTFGTSLTPAEDKPKPFAFGASTTSADSSKPFSFGAPAAEPEAGIKPKPFTFGGSTLTSDDKAKPFSFNSGNDSNQAAFSFSKPLESTLNTAKPFTFSSSANADSNKSTPFTFGSTLDKPLEAKPAFNFSSTFNFAAPLSSALIPSDSSNKENEDKVEEHEPTTDFTPVVKLDQEAEVKTGEEDEEVRYTKRSKLSLLAGTEYQSKGLGELKILFNKATSKTRILIRADGSLRVLLNTLIQKDFKYEKVGKGNMVKFPCVNGEGNLETYIIQVKTPTDGDELLKAIEEGKSTL